LSLYRLKYPGSRNLSGANYPVSRNLSGAYYPRSRNLSGANYPGSRNLTGVNHPGSRNLSCATVLSVTESPMKLFTRKTLALQKGADQIFANYSNKYELNSRSTEKYAD
jgi:hypothetical protein